MINIVLFINGLFLFERVHIHVYDTKNSIVFCFVSVVLCVYVSL